jgi:hypothetical protein
MNQVTIAKIPTYIPLRSMDISVNLNNLFELFTTHSLSNSTIIEVVIIKVSKRAVIVIVIVIVVIVIGISSFFRVSISLSKSLSHSIYKLNSKTFKLFFSFGTFNSFLAGQSRN